jgi:hypothetical protein
MSKNNDSAILKADNTFQIPAFSKQLKLITKVMKDLEDEMTLMRQQNDGVQHRADQRKFNTSKEEKFRSRISNTCDHNAFMMIDKEHKAGRITKVYKEINKKHEE